MENNWSCSCFTVSAWIIKNETDYAHGILVKQLIIIQWPLFSGLYGVCLAALSPKPMETGPDHRTGLCILAALKLLLLSLCKEAKPKRLNYLFYTLGEVAAAEI